MTTTHDMRRRYANYSSLDNHPDDVTPEGFPGWRQVMKDLEFLEYEQEHVYDEDVEYMKQEYEEELASAKSNIEDLELEVDSLEKKSTELQTEVDDLFDEVQTLKDFIRECFREGKVPSEDDVKYMCESV